MMLSMQRHGESITTRASAYRVLGYTCATPPQGTEAWAIIERFVNEIPPLFPLSLLESCLPWQTCNQEPDRSVILFSVLEQWIWLWIDYLN